MVAPRWVMFAAVGALCAAVPSAASADRGLELVSMADDGAYEVVGIPAPASGDRVFFTTRAGQPPGVETEGSAYELFGAARGADGWIQTWLNSWTVAPDESRVGTPSDIYRPAADGSIAVVDVTRDVRLPTSPGGTRYLHRLGVGLNERIGTGNGVDIPIATAGGGGVGRFAAVTEDLSTVAFVTSLQIDTTHDTGSTRQIYVQRPDGVHLVSKPTPAATGRPAPANTDLSLSKAGRPTVLGSPLSEDGSQVVFQTTEALDPTDTNNNADVYAWQDGTVKYLTRDMGLGSGGVTLQGASRDGRYIVIRTRTSLTPDDPLPAKVYNRLYRLDVETGTLALLNGEYAAAATTLNSGNLRALSPDGSAAILTFSSDIHLWRGGPLQSLPAGIDFSTLRMSDDGTRLLFETTNALVAEDNDGQRDVYLWEAAGPTVTCLSCSDRDTGAFPSVLGDNQPESDRTWYTATGGDAEFSRGWTEDRQRVYFSTAEALTPDARDNGKLKIYEWTASGLELVSPPDLDEHAYFVDTSADGSSVWFTTRAALVSQDADAGYLDLYVMREGGGFPDVPETSNVGGPAPPGDGGGAPGLVSTPSTRPTVPELPPAPQLGDEGGDPDGPSRGTVRLVSRRLTVSRGAALVRLRTSGAGEAHVRLRRGKRAIGSASATLNDGGTVRLRVMLNRQGRAVLDRRGRMGARLVVRFAPEEGEQVTRRWRVRLQGAATRGERGR